MKRLYNCLAEQAGKEVDATHILTGEGLGQVLSQTLENLGAIERVTSLQMLRPLLGFDKTSIMHMSQALSTFDLRMGPEVCGTFSPSLPTIIANLKWLEKSENRLGGLDQIPQNTFHQRRTVKL